MSFTDIWNTITAEYWTDSTEGERRSITEQILQYLDKAAHFISLSGVVVIVGGFLLATGRYIAEYREPEPAQASRYFRIRLGQASMLGLEIMIVAKVIGTLTTEPTLNSLAVLASLVAIRILFSWTLFLDIEGRWPWQAVKGD